MNENMINLPKTQLKLLFCILVMGGLVFGISLTSADNAFAHDSINPGFPHVHTNHFEGADKAIVLFMTFNDDDTVTFDSSVVSLKTAPGHPPGPPFLQVQVIDVKDNLINQFNLMNPTWISVHNMDGSHSFEIQSSVPGRVIVPFESDASFTIIDDIPTNQELIEVDLKPIIHDFCIANLDDIDCYESDLEINSIGAVNPPPLVLLGQSDNFTIQSIIVNIGPEEPVDGVDAIFNQEVTNVSPKIIVTPTEVVDQAEDDIGLGPENSRENNQIYNIECLEPGIHEATFTSEIEPLSAAVIDLVEANNSKKFILSVDCAVPVTLNIKPHSDPNSINTKSKGNIPTAVLTTEEGEYGNPIAVDATTILPLTVHFGSKDLSINDNGATEKHNKEHIEDSFELDEVTQDGDDDMVLHFPTQDTELAPGDTEACIKGKLVDNGNELTFFGCDFVNIVK